MRRAGDKRLDLVLSAGERATVRRLAGPEGPQKFLKRLVNEHIKRFGLPETPLALRSVGRPTRPFASGAPPVFRGGSRGGKADRLRAEPDYRGIVFGDGYYIRTGGD